MGWRRGCNLPYSRRYFGKKMLVRKTAKSRLSQRERKRREERTEEEGRTEKERRIHMTLLSAVSQCVIIFDRISHASVVYSKLNFILESTLFQLQTS